MQNAYQKTPFAPRFRDGTYWCDSNSWNPAGGLQNLLSNDEFDMKNCDGHPLLSSTTATALSSQIDGLLFNRQDSEVHVYNSNQEYKVVTNVNWFCLFDCDGSTYSIFLPQNPRIPKVFIASDKFNWLSSSKFKVKVVYVDNDASGMPKANNISLNDITSNPDIYKRIVAVIISEVLSGNQAGGSANWTQNTFLMFPPPVDSQPGDAKAAESNFISKVKLLDGIFAMMPDQVQTSPELRDAEEKLDELRFFMRLQGVGAGHPIDISDAADADLMFDIFSPFDATTAVTWQSPLRAAPKLGKIETTLKTLVGS